jgi:hypothetical protein
LNRSIEAQRVLERYRRLILLGRLVLPFPEAQRLLGPDRAYHLYFRSEPPAPRSRRRRRRGRR